MNEEYSLADVQVMLRQLRALKTENAEMKHLIVKYKAMISNGGGGGFGGSTGGGGGGLTPSRSGRRNLSPRPGSPRASRPADFNRKPSFNDSGGVPNIGDNRWLRNSTGFEDLLNTTSSPTSTLVKASSPRSLTKKTSRAVLSTELSFVEEDKVKPQNKKSGDGLMMAMTSGGFDREKGKLEGMINQLEVKRSLSLLCLVYLLFFIYHHLLKLCIYTHI